MSQAAASMAATTTQAAGSTGSGCVPTAKAQTKAGRSPARRQEGLGEAHTPAQGCMPGQLGMTPAAA
eukprot:6194655-Pleurochrysis_carterae.AAC.1